MRISGYTGSRETAPRRKATNAQPKDFSVANDDGGTPLGTDKQLGAPALVSVTPPATLETIAALAALAPSGEERAKQQAQGLLAALEELRVALLVGRVGKKTIGRMVALTEIIDESTISDRRTADLLQEIKLRAKVELAKIDRLTG